MLSQLLKALLAKDPFDSPETPRPKGGLVARLASGTDKAIMRTAIKLRRTFLAMYRER